MSRSGKTPEFKIELCEKYLSGEDSYQDLAEKNQISSRTLREWVRKYQEHGASCFAHSFGNAQYSKEFKIQCVEFVLSGQGTVDDSVAKFNISNRKVLRNWIKKYNAHMELKDYEPKREVYMAEAKRKTTLSERKEIAEYCIEHDKDYKGTAALFDVSYSQVYSWVQKYEKLGEDGLEDRRGHRKSDEEVDELERLRRENKRLKRQLEESNMLNELLKKVKEFEGM
ncbi:MAG: helix-turn-helix domain-containing protein [Candidatus Limivicinus sp.]|jgi:transposase